MTNVLASLERALGSGQGVSTWAQGRGGPAKRAARHNRWNHPRGASGAATPPGAGEQTSRRKMQVQRSAGQLQEALQPVPTRSLLTAPTYMPAFIPPSLPPSLPTQEAATPPGAGGQTSRLKMQVRALGYSQAPGIEQGEVRGVGPRSAGGLEGGRRCRGGAGKAAGESRGIGGREFRGFGGGTSSPSLTAL